MSIKIGNTTIAGRAQVDSTPVSGSTNAVSSGGVYTALSGKADSSIAATVTALDTAVQEKSNDSAVVHKTGNISEDITGEKNFTGQVTIQGADRYFNGLRIKNTDIPNNYTLPSQDMHIYPTIGIANDNSFIGWLDLARTTNGNTTLTLNVRRRDSSSDYNHSGDLKLGIDPNNTVYTSAPACTRVNSIVTTVSRTVGEKGGFKLGNGLIVNWARWTQTSTQQTITFSIPFTSDSSYGAAISYDNVSSVGSNCLDMSTISRSATTFKTCNMNRNCTATLIAIGY